METSKKTVLFAAMAATVLATGLALSGCASCSGPASSTVGSTSASASASASSSAAASASSSLSEEGDVEAQSASVEGSVEAVETDSGQVEGGSGSGSSTLDENNGSSHAGSSSQPAHEHSWTWVPNVVTIVDEDAYDEPVYRYARWCNKCNTEVSNNHNEQMMLQGESGHSLGSLRVVDYYIHHDAVTHTEDHGYNQCAGCGATK